MFFKKSEPQSELDLDRTILSLTGSNNKDDQIILRDIFEHIFITGSTGAGKTSTVGYYLIQKLLNAQNLRTQDKIGMIVFLYKSGDIHQWLKWVEQQNRTDDLIIINSDDKDVFNLLEYYQDKEAITAVNALMQLSGLSLGGGTQKQTEQYWEQAKTQRLHRLVLLNKLSGEKLNIKTLYKIHTTAPQTPEQLEDKEFITHCYCWQLLCKAADKVGKTNPQFLLVEDYFMREIPYLADRTQSSILSMVSAILDPFLTSPILERIFCGETTISLDEMLSGKIVLLNIPIQQYEYSGKLAQIMFKYVLQKRIESRNLNQISNPVVLMLDEYQHYLTDYDYLFLSTARSSRAGCVLMTQNISNLFAQTNGTGRIAEEKVNSLLSLCNHKFFLAQNSFVTNEFASKTIGMGKHLMSSTNVNTRDSSGTAGQSESYHYKVMPDEFTMLKRGGKHNQGIVEAYVLGTGKTFSNGENYLKVPFEQPWFK